MTTTENRYAKVRPVMDDAVRWAKTNFAAHVETDALEDVAINAFLYVDKVWNETRGASFTTFLRLCLRHRLFNISNRKARQYSLGKASATSVATNLHITDELAAYISAPAPRADTSAALLERLKRAVSRKAYKLAEALLADDHTLAQARRQLKLSVDEARLLLNEVSQVAFNLEPLASRPLVEGMQLVARYGGKTYRAEVITAEAGLVCRVGRRVYPTLSAAARAITKHSCNGWEFFSLMHEAELAETLRDRHLITAGV